MTPTTDLATLSNILMEARTYINAAEWRLGRMNRPIPLRLYSDLTLVQRENQRIAEAMAEALARQQSGQLGAIFTILIGGAAVAVTALATWIVKNRSDAKELETRATLYERMITDHNMSPEKAAELVLGSRSGVAQILDKVLLVGLLGVGIFVMIKVIK